MATVATNTQTQSTSTTVAGKAKKNKGSRRSAGASAKKAEAAKSKRQPTEAELVDAVESLCHDELRPYGRLIRKRLAELAAATDADAPDAELNTLRTLCSHCAQLCVNPEGEADWFVVPIGSAVTFVDIYNGEDIYGEEFWSEFSEYLEGLEDEDMLYPGGRYVCAQGLMSRSLSFLAEFSLGQVSQIVQLAMGCRKLLGYRNGAIVPYARSETALKEQCAGNQMLVKKGKLSIATWPVLDACLREMLATGGETGLPLSNVKRILRTRFKVELSETALGHATMTDLFKDARIQHMCKVRLLENGYFLFADTSLVANAHTADSLSAWQSQSIPSTCTLSTKPMLNCENNTYINCQPETQRASAAWDDGMQCNQVFAGSNQGFQIVALPVHLTFAVEEPPSCVWPQTHLFSDSGAKVCDESESCSGSTEEELSVLSREGHVTPDSLFNLPATPRILTEDTPSPKGETVFMQELCMALKQADDSMPCEGVDEDSCDHHGQRVMVRNTFINLVQVPEGFESSRAKSLPATPRLFEARRYSSVESPLDEGADNDSTKANILADADLNLLVVPRKELPALVDFPNIDVRNTFIDIKSPTPQMPWQTKSLPTTPGMRTVSATSSTEFKSASSFADQIAEALSYADVPLQCIDDASPLDTDGSNENITDEAGEVFRWTVAAVGCALNDRSHVTVKNTFVHVVSPDSEPSSFVDFRAHSLPASPWLQNTLAASPLHDPLGSVSECDCLASICISQAAVSLDCKTTTRFGTVDC
jgi:hypothetical protein